jgi:hypothetical protein
VIDQILKEVEEAKRKIEEIEHMKLIHYRELYPRIDHTNFQICTKVDFRGIEKPENHKSIRETFDRIKNEKPIIFEFKSKSGSEYFITPEGNVYRLSDHWGAVASCEWTREGEGNFMMSEMISGDLEIGVANLCDFKLFRRKEDRKVDKLLNPEWIEKMTQILKDIAPLNQKLESIIKSPEFKNFPLHEKQALGPAFGYISKHIKYALT